MSGIDPDPGPPPVGGRAAIRITTIERFLADHQPPTATGSLSRVLDDIALGGKLIASRTRRAGLTAILGRAGAINPQGEDQKLMDVYADEIMTSQLSGRGRVCAIISGEQADPILLDEDAPHVVVHDPLAGQRFRITLEAEDLPPDALRAFTEALRLPVSNLDIRGVH